MRLVCSVMSSEVRLGFASPAKELAVRFGCFVAGPVWN